MKQCSPLCNKVLGVVRIVAGLWMMYAGIMKLGADAQMMEMVGGAGTAMGLTFLSATTWFWIAVVGEILAGLFLVSGCCKLTKIGAWLTIVIMVFALNVLGWTTPDTVLAWVFLIAAVAILVWGRGARCFCSCAACKMCKNDSCCTGSCGSGMMKSGMEQMKQGAATIGAGAVASAQEMMETAKEKVEDVVEDVKEVVEEKTA